MNDEEAEPPFEDETAEPGPRLEAGQVVCPKHGRRRPWIVCEHLAHAIARREHGPDYRVYRLVWLYEGVAGAQVEYRLCHVCAAACELTKEPVDLERASERVEERACCACAGCGLEALVPPSKRPLVLERRV